MGWQPRRGQSTVTLISTEAAPQPALRRLGPKPSIRARTHGLEAPAPAGLATVPRGLLAARWGEGPGPARARVVARLLAPGTAPSTPARTAESSSVCAAGRSALTHVGRFGSPRRNCLLPRLDPRTF